MHKRSKLYCWSLIAAIVAISIAIYMGVPRAPTITPQVVLVIGEPYAQMLKDSTPKIIAPDIPNETWYNQVNEPAELHFNDPQYSFFTPKAKFLTVGYDHGVIDSIRMSPQVDTLNLDDAIKVILNLQDQWQKRGWVLTNPNDSPAYTNTLAERELARKNDSPTTYWSAGGKYQIMIFLQKFADSKRPSEERYLITMAISTPWVPKK